MTPNLSINLWVSIVSFHFFNQSVFITRGGSRLADRSNQNPVFHEKYTLWFWTTPV